MFLLWGRKRREEKVIGKIIMEDNLVKKVKSELKRLPVKVSLDK